MFCVVSKSIDNPRPIFFAVSRRRKTLADWETQEFMIIRSRGRLILNGRDLYPKKEKQLFGLAQEASGLMLSFRRVLSKFVLERF